MSKHPTREILESGGIVEGEAFELMLKEESQSEVIKELKEINQHLMDIKILMGYKDKLYCDSNIIAENKKEYKQNSNDIDIELYCEKKEPALEKKIADFLTENKVYYEKQETYIETEKIIQITFEI